MDAKQIRQSIVEYKKHLKASEGCGVVFSETGPANMAIVEALLSALESQERRIAQLEKNTPLAFT